jgi:cell wall-associated NlpC family hydrolase
LKTGYLLSATLVSTLFTLAIPATSAFAATNSESIVVKHNAYLITAPRLHASKIVLEHTGEALQLETGSTNYYWHVEDQHGHSGYISRGSYWTAQENVSGSPAGSTGSGASNPMGSTTNTGGTTTNPASGTTSADKSDSSASSITTTTQLPPGVTFDSKVDAAAPLDADYQTKLNAILTVAESKLGTPYSWGHNEDRGQSGFDCSNFTEYVFHHALGYIMSTSSQTQYHSVGWSVPVSSMRPGDLLVFNQGGHVGIYIGNGQMIQCGGGLAKVGYLKVSEGSYWYTHISSVKRMF